MDEVAAALDLPIRLVRGPSVTVGHRVVEDVRVVAASEGQHGEMQPLVHQFHEAGAVGSELRTERPAPVLQAAVRDVGDQHGRPVEFDGVRVVGFTAPGGRRPFREVVGHEGRVVAGDLPFTEAGDLVAQELR